MKTQTIQFDDGKYAIHHEDGLSIRATRHGEPWRDFTGDKLIYWMVIELERLRAQAAELTDAKKGPAAQAVAKILDGIDKDEGYCDEGWWPTSTGVQFGTERLALVLAVVQELEAECDRLRAQVEALKLKAAYLDRAYAAFGRAHFPDEGQPGMLINATRFWDLLGGEHGSENWPDEVFLTPEDAPDLVQPEVDLQIPNGMEIFNLSVNEIVFDENGDVEAQIKQKIQGHSKTTISYFNGALYIDSMHSGAGGGGERSAPQPLTRPAVPDLDEVDWPDVEDMAHGALQEALSFGLNHDVINRFGQSVMKKTRDAMLAAPQTEQMARPAVPDVDRIRSACSQVITALSEIVCAQQTDEQFDASTIPRDLLLGRVQSIREQINVIWQTIATAPQPEAAQPNEPTENQVQAAFENWLAEKCPSGDDEAVHRQWEACSDYAELYGLIQKGGA